MDRLYLSKRTTTSLTTLLATNFPSSLWLSSFIIQDSILLMTWQVLISSENDMAKLNDSKSLLIFNSHE